MSFSFNKEYPIPLNQNDQTDIRNDQHQSECHLYNDEMLFLNCKNEKLKEIGLDDSNDDNKSSKQLCRSRLGTHD